MSRTFITFVLLSLIFNPNFPLIISLYHMNTCVRQNNEVGVTHGTYICNCLQLWAACTLMRHKRKLLDLTSLTKSIVKKEKIKTKTCTDIFFC